MNLLTGDIKEQLRERYVVTRDRLIRGWLAREKKAIEAGRGEYMLPGERNFRKLFRIKRNIRRADRYYRLAEVYWRERLLKRRAFAKLPPAPARSRPTQRPFYERYGLVPEGYYYLVFDGREYDNAVKFEVDEPTATISIRSYQ